jgi:Family of unknown function (DUF6370)
MYAMKKLFTFLFVMFSVVILAQDKNESSKIQIVEASCGQCQFGMEGKSCDLAVRIDGKSYFVEGTNIDAHGDAHANDGFCASIRKAAVIGTIKDNKFVVTYFKLQPITKQ